VFVSSVIVDDQVNIEFGRYALVQSAQGREKLLMAVSRLAFREDRSGGDIQRSEQSSCSVTNIIMGHTVDVAEAHGQDGLSSIQSLNLVFLIHAEHQCMIRRIEIKPGNVSHLFDEERIVGELKCA